MINFVGPTAMPDGYTTKFSLLNDESETRAKCSGASGTLGHVAPLEIFVARGEARFPNRKSIPERCEDVLQDFQAKDLVDPAFPGPTIGPPDKRSLWATISEDEGESLENCETPWDLCECLLHAMLNWLDYYQRGYFHRDVSIGNVLRLKQRSERKPLSFLPVLQLVPNAELTLVDSAAGSSIDNNTDSFWDNLLERATPEERAVAMLARDIEMEIKALGVGTECLVILGDSDLPVLLHGSFEGEHLDSISGTPEFMSKSLMQAIQLQEAYVQNPTDVAESFWWIATWAVLFNRKVPATSPRERSWQASLRRDIGDRDSVARAFTRITSTLEPYSPAVRVMSPILKSWDQLLEAAEGRWVQEWRRVDVATSSSRDKELIFRKFAYSGVLDFVKVIRSHRETLMKVSQVPP